MSIPPANRCCQRGPDLSPMCPLFADTDDDHLAPRASTPARIRLHRLATLVQPFRDPPPRAVKLSDSGGL